MRFQLCVPRSPSQENAQEPPQEPPQEILDRPPRTFPEVSRNLPFAYNSPNYRAWARIAWIVGYVLWRALG